MLIGKPAQRHRAAAGGSAEKKLNPAKSYFPEILKINWS
jgi:hypothetical protein